MKIVFVADRYTIGGATESMLRLMLELRRDYRVQPIVCTSQMSEFNTRLDDLNIENYVTGHGQFLFSPPSFPVKRPIAVLDGLASYQVNLRTSLRRAKEQIDFSDVRLIHSNLPRTDFGELLADEVQVPHICHLREFSFEDFRCVSFRRRPAQFLSDNSEALIAVSESVKRAWVDKGASEEKIKVVYNGIDLEKIRVLPNRPAPNLSGTIRCVFLGGCSEAKGIWDAIHAIEALRCRVDICLDIYSSDSRYTALKVDRYVRRKNLQGAVRLHGRCSNIYELLPEYDFSFACSRSEGFGRIVIESQASGVPVVAANSGAFPELIEHGVNGFLYQKSRGAESLAETLLRAIEDDGTWNTARRGGISSSKQFDSANNAAEVWGVYQDVLERWEK